MGFSLLGSHLMNNNNEKRLHFIVCFSSFSKECLLIENLPVKSNGNYDMQLKGPKFDSSTASQRCNTF